MGELSCGKSCMKYILFVINFIFFILGAAAFGLGIWALVDKNKMNVLSKVGADDSDFNVTGLLESAAIVLMVGGIAILIIGFLGCCGAMKESQCLLVMYGILLIVILIIQIAAIAIAAAFRTKVEDELNEFLRKTINSTYEGKIDTSEEFSLGLDYAQVYFQCCGINNYTDFQFNATKWNRTTSDNKRMEVPPTCCKLKNKDDYYSEPSKAELEDTNCPVVPTPTNSNKEKPCWKEINDYLQQRITIVIGIAAAILVLELICLVFACCVITAIRKDN